MRRTVPPAGAAARVFPEAASRRGSKGKQVRILYDPVTVSGEREVKKSLAGMAGKAACARRSASQETCRTSMQEQPGEKRFCDQSVLILRGCPGHADLAASKEML